MKKLSFISIILFCCLCPYLASAQCAPATSQESLDINNVDISVLNGGDMWWDLINPMYEVPVGSGLHSIFVGALWVGGIDSLGQLRLAGQRYRTNGNDFWPGPLDNTGNVTAGMCTDYDRHWKVNRSTVDSFVLGQTAGIPSSILLWPGTGNTNLAFTPSGDAAPFFDTDGDGIYDPSQGDYPDIKGDQAVWWVYNDAGNVHSETGGLDIGLEIKAMAYAYATNDVLNNTTFYQYKLTKKSSGMLDTTFIGLFIDPDLGCYTDDFVGCDTSRNLGICYNGDGFDENCASPGYGNDIPMIGVSMLQGPKDQGGSEIGMSSFVYFNNGNCPTCDPNNATEYYNYMKGIWNDGTPVTFGGNGYGGVNPFPYVYPDDPTNAAGWSECTAGNTPADRRFVLCFGPFQLEQGVTKNITFAVVWVRDSLNYPCPGFADMTSSVDSVQQFYDSTLCNNMLISFMGATNASFGNCDGQAAASVGGGCAIYTYQWDAAAGNQTTAIADSLCPGSYTVTVTDENGCTAVDSVTVNENVGIETVDIVAGIDIYPNPATANIIIRNPSGSDGVLKIHTVAGVLAGEINITKTTEQIDLSDYPAGAYLLEFSSREATVTKKLIIVR